MSTNRARDASDAPLLRDVSAVRDDLLASRPLVIDFFSGVGGLSLGLECAGFFVAVHVEIDETASKYAEYNFPMATTFGGPAHGDIRTISTDALTSSVPHGREVALIAGGPPCQGFSYAGRKNPNDPLNELVLHFAEKILAVKPSAFLMENVPGIKAENIWQLAKAMELLSAQYEVSEPTNLNAADFGVPQDRERVFVLGIRRDLGIRPSLPAPTHVRPGIPLGLFTRNSVTPTVAEALSDLPDIDQFPHLVNGDTVAYASKPHGEYQRVMREQSHLAQPRGYFVVWDRTTCTNCRRTLHGPVLTARLAALREGQADKMSGIRRLESDGISTTIRAGTTAARGAWSAPRPRHYAHVRVISTRECARLQSFPDWFRFHPVKWHGNRQVGNAVPPLLAQAIGRHILTLLGKEQNETVVGMVQRPDDLIAADILAANEAGLDTKKTTFQVVGTRRRP